MLYEIEWMDDASEMRDDLPEHYGSTIVEAPEPEKNNGEQYYRLPTALVDHAISIARDWAWTFECNFEVRISGYAPARFGFETGNGGAHSWRYVTFIEPFGRPCDPDRAEALAVLS